MAFNSLTFLLFFLVVFVLNTLVASRPRLRVAMLTLASYAFYAAGDLRNLPLLLVMSTVGFVLGTKVARAEAPARRKLWLVAGLGLLLASLGVFKYWNFGLSSLEIVTGWNTSRLQISSAFPVGISFYTFELISYLVDVYRRSLEPCRSYPQFLLFMSFFPKVMQGPIVRATNFVPQLSERWTFAEDKACEGLFLIALGLFKKVVIADYLGANLVSQVFGEPGKYSSLEVAAGVYGYAVQLYCDFSGYTDMAMGCAALLGLSLVPNFNSPYKAQNLSDFWNRWHISLSSWIRDYLFFPMGGAMGSTLRTVRNFALTMLLAGLWHGAAWTFVCWGLLHGLGLGATFVVWDIKQRLGIKRRRKGKMRVVWGILGTFLTFHFVCFSWILFGADSFKKAWVILQRLASGTTYHPNLHAWVLIVLGVGLVSHYVPENLFARVQRGFVRMPAWAQATVLFLVGVVVHEAASVQSAPFMYQQF